MEFRSLTLFNLEGARSRTRGYSSAGRAPALQAGGQRFDPVYLHHPISSAIKMGARGGLDFLGGNEFRLRQGFGAAKTLGRATRRGLRWAHSSAG